MEMLFDLTHYYKSFISPENVPFSNFSLLHKSTNQCDELMELQEIQYRNHKFETYLTVTIDLFNVKMKDKKENILKNDSVT